MVMLKPRNVQGSHSWIDSELEPLTHALSPVLLHFFFALCDKDAATSSSVTEQETEEGEDHRGNKIQGSPGNSALPFQAPLHPRYLFLW